jgi:hypothetical protein
LAEDAIRSWPYRSWIFPRDPDFLQKAGRVLDLYAGGWEGKLLEPGDFVICADAKPSIQARRRIHPSLPPASRRGQRVEHEYQRLGAVTYLDAWDVRRGRVMGRTERKGGIAPFDRLVWQVMTKEPYRSARRVFWIVDNGSDHRGQASIDRLQGRWSNLILVHPRARQLAQPGRDLPLDHKYGPGNVAVEHAARLRRRRLTRTSESFAIAVDIGQLVGGALDGAIASSVLTPLIAQRGERRALRADVLHGRGDVERFRWVADGDQSSGHFRRALVGLRAAGACRGSESGADRLLLPRCVDREVDERTRSRGRRRGGRNLVDAGGPREGCCNGGH